MCKVAHFMLLQEIRPRAVRSRHSRGMNLIGQYYPTELRNS